MGPVLVAGLERSLDQQAAEAGAVDEQVGGKIPPVLELYARNEATVAMQHDAGHFAFDARDTAPLRIFAQVSGVQACIEVIGVIVGRQHIARSH